ncbi:MAG: gamma-glutamyl-gamma-aminobutyrate hydrolase family protein [Kiritimatiellae bacterium]|nr:gamma-glutamyl-gamma-aminobutyrate hydrolase family protein [Kiritimatiellia bacterium]
MKRVVLVALAACAVCAEGKPLYVGIVDRCKGDVAAAEKTFVDNVIETGNVPFVIPRTTDTNAVDALLARADILIFQGSAFSSGRKPPQGKTVEDVRRWEIDRIAFEKLVMSRAAPRRIPVVGICRGINVINTFFGGAYTNEDYSVTNRVICHMQNKVSKKPGWQPHHEITIDRNSRLYSVLGEERVMVNSFHRTGPGVVAPGFRVVARAPDGVIEAIEGDAYPAFAFQFHPETMARHDRRFLNLFRHLPELAGLHSNAE